MPRSGPLDAPNSITHWIHSSAKSKGFRVAAVEELLVGILSSANRKILPLVNVFKIRVPVQALFVEL